MPVLNPDTDAEQIADRLTVPATSLVACLCAEWCGTCRDYRADFARLAAGHPDMCFVWIDVEDHSDLFDDLDVENFPTILIQDSIVPRFFGTVLPQASIVERMLTDLSALPKVTDAPKLRQALCMARSAGMRE
jgi:thioredoxin 1